MIAPPWVFYVLIIAVLGFGTLHMLSIFMTAEKFKFLTDEYLMPIIILGMITVIITTCAG